MDCTRKKAHIMTMSDLVKAQNMPHTRWTSLGANGTPDKLIKEGLKQPYQIKVSFEKGTKEITGHVAPNKA
jgi:hypothetical protein